MFARTPRLLLRPGFPEDAPALAGIMSDKIARNLAVVPWPYSLRDAEAFLASPRDPVLPSLLIFERGQNAPQLVGSCGLGRRPSGAVELGYFVMPGWRRRGLAEEAARAMMDWARRVHGVRRFVVSIGPANAASVAMARKLGFVRIGSHVDEEDGYEDILALG